MCHAIIDIMICISCTYNVVLAICLHCAMQLYSTFVLQLFEKTPPFKNETFQYVIIQHLAAEISIDCSERTNISMHRYA